MSAILGRDREVALGLESTFGTAAASATWIERLDFDPALIREDEMDPSGNGRMEKNKGSILTRKSSTPTLSLIARKESLGMILKGLFRGGIVTSNDDPEAGVYTHTFNMPASQAPVSYSIFYKDENTDKVITGAVINTATINIVQNDYIKIDLAFFGKYPASASSTPSYTADTPFTGSMATVKIANAISGLAGASAICMQDATIEVNNNVDNDFYCLGNTEPTSAIFGVIEANISFNRIKTDNATIQDKFDSSTKQACLVSVVDSGTTIGASSNPTFTFTFAPSLVKDYAESTGMDEKVVESFALEGIYSSSDGKKISATVINTSSAYTAS